MTKSVTKATESVEARLPDFESWEAWSEYAYENLLTDGLPVYPPSEAAVSALVGGSGRDASDEIGPIAPRNAMATVETVAANAAMAGCKPEYMPYVLAAVEAMLEESFNLQGVQTTAHPCAPMVIVSGPASQDIGLMTHECLFSGAGSRANLAIGRAVRLVLWNLGGAFPGEPVKEVFGHPGRLAYCIAEDIDNSPWAPFHHERGIDASETSVTVFACEAPHSVVMFMGNDNEPSSRLDSVADTMSARGNNNTHFMGECLVVIAPNAAQHIASHGWSKDDVRRYLFDKARRRLDEIRPISERRPNNDRRYWYDWWPSWVNQWDDDTIIPVVERPEDIHVVVSGANSMPWTSVCPGWGDLGGFAVTRRVTLEGT